MNASSHARRIAPRVIVLAVFIVGLVLLSIYLGTRAREARLLRQGCIEGFELNGAYRSDDLSSQAAFLTWSSDSPGNSDDAQGEWQIVLSHGDPIDGTYRVTNDPNIVTLLDDSGAIAGMAHLAYAQPDGNDGLLYITLGTEEYMLSKVAGTPGFVRTS